MTASQAISTMVNELESAELGGMAKVLIDWYASNSAVVDTLSEVAMLPTLRVLRHDSDKSPEAFEVILGAYLFGLLDMHYSILHPNPTESNHG